MASRVGNGAPLATRIVGGSARGCVVAVGAASSSSRGMLRPFRLCCCLRCSSFCCGCRRHPSCCPRRGGGGLVDGTVGCTCRRCNSSSSRRERIAVSARASIQSRTIAAHSAWPYASAAATARKPRAVAWPWRSRASRRATAGGAFARQHTSRSEHGCTAAPSVRASAEAGCTWHSACSDAPASSRRVATATSGGGATEEAARADLLGRCGFPDAVADARRSA